MDRFDKVVLLHRVILCLGVVLGPAWNPAPGGAQIPPGEDWQTLHTEHFRITYPRGLQELGQRAGQRAEKAWTSLSEVFLDPPGGKVDLVVTDNLDISNGFSQVFPSNRIVIYATPPVDGFGLPFMDEWMELVVTHELVHIFHEDDARNLSGFLRRVFGRLPMSWPFFPGSATPGWVVEGIATYYESELTQAGRVRGSFHEMVVRTAVLEGGFESIDQSSGDSPTWPGGQRYYVYGSLFLKHLMDQAGGEAMGAFARNVAGQWVPYRPNSAAKDAVGVSFSEAWEEWRSQLNDRYEALRDSLERRAPLTQGEALTGEGYYAWSPEPSPAGDGLAFARSDGRSDPQIRYKELGTGTERKLARTNNLSQFSWTPAGNILFSQLDYMDSYRARGDLFLLDSDGEVSRITKGARLDHADVAPDGERAVAVQEGEGTNRLVMVSLPGGEIEPLTARRDQELWAYPRWSPDGRWIAASRWRAGAYFDVVILTPEGHLLWEVTGDRAVDNAPAWSPDGRWLLWSSDRSGIPNLYAAPVNPDTGEPGPMLQVTNLLGGGAYPSVDPAGNWIYFSSYHADGWRVERIPYRPEEWFEPFPLHLAFRGEVDTTHLQERVRVQGAPYKPLPTLAPTYWAPMYREGESAGGVEVLQPGYGIFTTGRDLVGRHAYSLAGTFSGGAATFNGQVSYSYEGLENPLLGVWWSQSHDADPLRGAKEINEAGDTVDVPLFQVEREQSVGVSTTLLRRRSRNATALTLSAAHAWEDRSLLEEDLQESQRFGLKRPEGRLAEARAVLTFGNARVFPFSISSEDGISAVLQGRFRWDLTLADSLRDVAGSDGSYQDLMARLAAFKGFRGPGFGNHVVGIRASGGVASGPGADGYHFEVGGASGADVPIQFLDFGQGLFFPVRGYPTASRYGRTAWSASMEYRFPIKLVNRGAGLFPLHLDWLSGSLFLDAGNAWGPELEMGGYHSVKKEALASAGGEVMVRILPLWFQNMNLRFGLAFPLTEIDPSVGKEGLGGYLRLGASF